MKKSRPVKKKRKVRRRRGPGVLLTLFCVVLIGAAILTAMTIFFKIRVIEVEGESPYAAEEIVGASGIQVGENMYLFNKFSATNRIFMACPYLDEIAISRKLPDRVVISVTQSQPVCAATDGAGWYLLDVKGKILEKVDQEAAAQSCVVKGDELVGPEIGKTAVFSDKEKQKALFTVLNTARNSDILKGIREINVERYFEIKFWYLGRFSVRVGTAEDMEKKLRFLSVVVDNLGSTETGVIDVSDTKTARFRPYSS